MHSSSWQRVVSIALFVAGAIVAMVMHEPTLAATLIGLAGGIAIPPMPPVTLSPVRDDRKQDNNDRT